MISPFEVLIFGSFLQGDVATSEALFQCLAARQVVMQITISNSVPEHAATPEIL
jgi:hypothetical protein